MGLLLAFSLVACHKEEQAVEGVTHTAVKAEHQAQATATERDQERAQLEQIPLPTKSLYIDIHDPAAWANPFLSVGADTLTLRIILPDANPSPVGQGTLLRPEAARRQELQLRLSDLDKAVVAIPAGAWPTAASSPSPNRPPPRPKTAPWSAATSKPSSASSTTSAWSSKSGRGGSAQRRFPRKRATIFP